MTIRVFCLPSLLLTLACQKAPAQEVAATPAVTAAAQAASAPPSTEAQAPAGQPPARPIPAELPAVVARVNGQAIDRAEFERAVQSVQARAGGPVPAERRDEILRNILDQLVAYHLLAQESTARNVPVTDAELDTRIAEIKKQFPTEAAFAEALKQRQVSPEQLRIDLRKDILIAKMLDTEVSPKVMVQPKDVSDFYAQNPDRFKEDESVKASHILLRVPESSDEPARKKIQTQAEDVLRKVRAPDADFAALAKEYSQDGSAVNGGDLGFFGKGQMVPAFEAAAFALQPGAVSDVITSQFGFHIIKVTERRSARVVPLTEVSEQIEGFLREKGREEQTAAFVERLKAKGKVEILI